MAIGAKIWQLLTNDLTLSRLVALRVYPNVLKQGAALPAIVYTIIDDIPQNVIAARPTMRHARVQIDCYSLHLDHAQEVADAVEGVLSCIMEVDFTSMQLDREDSYEDATLYHRVRMDFSLWRNV